MGGREGGGRDGGRRERERRGGGRKGGRQGGRGGRQGGEGGREKVKTKTSQRKLTRNALSQSSIASEYRVILLYVYTNKGIIFP